MTSGPATRTRLPIAMWWLAAGWTLASTADTFVLFVLVWIAEPQGWTGVQTAVLVLALRLPAAFGGVIGGRAVDRLGPVPMIVLDGVVRAALMAALVVAGWNGRFDVWIVLALGAAAGATAPLSFAAARTLVPRLVEADGVGRANALLGVGDQLPILAGAALAGPGLALLGPGRAFLVPFVMLLCVAAIAVRLRHSAGGRAAEVVRDRRPGTWWRSPRVVVLVALSVAYYFTYGPFETVLPHFVRDDLAAGVGGYTVLWIVFGAGALLTLPLAARLARHRPGVANALGAAIWGLLVLPFCLTDELPVAVVLFALAGAVWGPYSAIEATALQRWTDPAEHGRVFGTQRAILTLAWPLGAALGAVAVDHLPPAPTLMLAAAGCAAAGLLALTVPGLRRSG
jgi:predicted MFS family arabinose efflux permease